MKHKLLEENMKRTIINLRKKGRETKKNYFIALSNMLDTARRRRAKVNVFKLNILVKRHPEKIFVVPGTVLGYGILDKPIKVYAYKYSTGALDKIKSNKGSAKTLDDLIKENLEGKDIMILR